MNQFLKEDIINEFLSDTSITAHYSKCATEEYHLETPRNLDFLLSTNTADSVIKAAKLLYRYVDDIYEEYLSILIECDTRKPLLFRKLYDSYKNYPPQFASYLGKLERASARLSLQLPILNNIDKRLTTFMLSLRAIFDEFNPIVDISDGLLSYQEMMTKMIDVVEIADNYAIKAYYKDKEVTSGVVFSVEGSHFDIYTDEELLSMFGDLQYLQAKMRKIQEFLNVNSLAYCNTWTVVGKPINDEFIAILIPDREDRYDSYNKEATTFLNNLFRYKIIYT